MMVALDGRGVQHTSTMTHSSLPRLALAALALAASCTSSVGRPSTAPRPRRDPNVVPALDREFRGLWVATVGNIDWPSKPGLTADQQRAELVVLLDRAQAAGMNAILFHVRTSADALYSSELEPWGVMLTGTQGTDPGYDPLTFAIAESHRRGMELHAWINPFRAGNAGDSARFAANHVLRERPDLVRAYGPQLWMDPGDPAVSDRSMRAILDIVTRYDVDGVHLDDYFYPYPRTDSAKRPVSFPDSATYARYGGGMPLDDWRRSNVNRFVERLYREVHAAKPAVRVGISPFGIWRPGNPPQVTGLDAYAAIYADTRKWLQSGWVDYLVPQLYWRIDPPQQSFTALLDWWLSQSTSGRPVWPGLATYRVYAATNPYPLSEMENQVAAARARGASGMVFFNTTSTLTRGNGEIASMLRRDFFTDAALPPAAPWLAGARPARPTIAVNAVTNGVAGATVTLTPAADAPRWWVIRYRTGDQWTTRVLFGDQRTITLGAEKGATDWVVVNAVNAVGATSDDAVWRSP
jgi:uncharacterized lipoprotein YddW (UPF0748 family)